MAEKITGRIIYLQQHNISSEKKDFTIDEIRALSKDDQPECTKYALLLRVSPALVLRLLNAQEVVHDDH